METQEIQLQTALFESLYHAAECAAIEASQLLSSVTMIAAAWFVVCSLFCIVRGEFSADHYDYPSLQNHTMIIT